MKRIFTKRNALLGWLAWKTGKHAAVRRAKRNRMRLLLVATGSIAAVALGAVSIAKRREPATG
jgi:hypothetical protein